MSTQKNGTDEIFRFYRPLKGEDETPLLRLLFDRPRVDVAMVTVWFSEFLGLSLYGF